MFFQIILFIPTDFVSNKGFLSKNEIQKIDSLGVEIGSHSHLHLNMKFLDKSDFIKDWETSIYILENLLDRKIKACSIPYGKYSIWQIKELRSLGFEKIYTSDVNSIRVSNNLATIGRVPIDSRFLWYEIFFLRILGLRYLSFKSQIVRLLKAFLHFLTNN